MELKLYSNFHLLDYCTCPLMSYVYCIQYTYIYTPFQSVQSVVSTADCHQAAVS